MSQFNDPRELRGLKILSEPDTIRNIDKNNWEVKSQSGNGYYHINRFYKDRHAQMRGQAVWSCLCPVMRRVLFSTAIVLYFLIIYNVREGEIMAKAKRASIKTVPTIEYNVFIRPIPPEVIRR